MPGIKDRIVEIAYQLKDQFSGRLAKITGGLRDVESASTRANESIEKDNLRSAKSYDGVIAAVDRTKLAILAVVAVVGAAASAIGRWTQAASVQERAETKLATILKNLTGASETQIQNLKDQASALQQLTGYGDEQTLSAQAMLGTFKLTAEQIAVLTPRLLDMAESARKAGNSEVDLESISIALGKAFTSGIGSLSRYGVAMSDAQKEAFKLAEQQEKVQILATVLDGNFNGLAKAVGDTYEGAVRKSDAAQGDFLETLGQLFTRNKAWISLTNTIGKAWVDMGAGISNSAQGIGNIVTLLAGIVETASSGIKIAWNAVTIAFQAAAIAAVKSAEAISRAYSFITFGDVSKKLKQFADDMAGTSQGISDGMVDDFQDIDEALGNTASELEQLNSKLQNTKTTTDSLGGASNSASTKITSLASSTDALTEALRKAESQAKKEVDEFASVIQSADSVKQKFAELTAEISGTAEKTEGFTFTDVVQAMTAAREALSAGDFDGAVQGAEKAGEMLRDMKKNGEESDGVLQALAMKIEDIAGFAVDERQSKELVDAEKAVAEVERIRQKIAALDDEKIRIQLEIDDKALADIDENKTVKDPEKVTVPIDYEIDQDLDEEVSKQVGTSGKERIEKLTPELQLLSAVREISSAIFILGDDLKNALTIDSDIDAKLRIDTTELDALKNIDPVVIPVRYELVENVSQQSVSNGLDEISKEAEKQGYRL